MVPVGRLTMVRTFAKSELIRAMSFVAIPGLIGPMLGPIAGGLIVGYFHWRVIFFVNIPIGLIGSVPGLSASAGLSRKVQSARYRRPHPVRLRHRAAVLCAGSVRRAHAERRAKFWGCWRFPSCCWPAMDCTRTKTAVSAAASEPVSHSHLSRGGERQLLHAAGHRRNPVPSSAALPGGPRVHADSIRPADDAAGDRRHEPEDDHAANSGALRLSRRADLQHRDPRPAHHAVRHHRRGHAGLAHRGRRRSASGSSPRCNTPA